MRKFTLWTVSLFLAADLLIAAIWAGVVIYPALPVYWKPVSQATPLCTRWRTVLDSRSRLRARKLQQSIAAASKVLSVDGRLRLVRTPHGNWWIPNSDSDPLPVLLAQHVTNYYGDAEMGVRSGDVVIDCGSHIGTFTRDALNRGAKKVIAVDPAPDAAECFRRNLSAEIAAGRVVLVEKGIWDSEGMLEFNLNGNADAASSFVVKKPSAKSVTVPVTTLDNIVRDLALDRVHFIKADVKGATERMLFGGSQTLSRFRPRLALATEEPPEEPSRLISVVRRIDPSYNYTCGHCFYAETQLRMEAVFLF